MDLLLWRHAEAEGVAAVEGGETEVDAATVPEFVFPRGFFFFAFFAFPTAVGDAKLGLGILRSKKQAEQEKEEVTGGMLCAVHVCALF